MEVAQIKTPNRVEKIETLKMLHKIQSFFGVFMSIKCCCCTCRRARW